MEPVSCVLCTEGRLIHCYHFDTSYHVGVCCACGYECDKHSRIPSEVRLSPGWVERFYTRHPEFSSPPTIH